MNINGIDIPEKVLTALLENKLVIFAGAGISNPPPSNLPTFNELAKIVENDTLCKRKAEEPIDTYLGRVHHEGKNIYEIIGQILSDDKSTFNDYHTNLLRLFPDDQIHLITTNQDVHFASSAMHILQKRPKMYFAPALPLAKSFTGIVYLHGNVADDLNNMVFTDSDFGEAYLVEGWASRFLKDLFSYYTVLFIGYSYNDPVMKYFARGMKYSETRFIFTCIDDGNTDDYWQRLHITPIYYNKENNHSELLKCIIKWADMYSLKYIDQKERLKNIISNRVTLTADEKDYLFYMISIDYGVKFFCELAQGYNWFEFLLNENKLEFLFDQKKELTFSEMYLTNWVIETIVILAIEEFLIVLSRKGNVVNPYFANGTIRSIYQLKKDNNQITVYLYHLIAVILNQPYNLSNDNLSFLISELVIPQELNTILLLFKYFLKPHIKLEKSYRFIGEEEFKESTDLKFSLTGEIYWLEETWNKKILPNIHLVAQELFITITEYIKYIYLFYDRSSGKDFVDSFSYMRSSIDKHEQDQYCDNIYILVDIAREIIFYLGSNDTKLYDSVFNIWMNSGALLLERLSTYMIQKATHIDSDKKIAWLIEQDWLYKPGAKKEVFELIKNTYFDLTPKLKNELIIEVLKFNKHKSTELNDYVIFNLLTYLNSCFPKDKTIEDELKKIMCSNPTFEPSEYPEFSSYMQSGNWEGIRSPKTKQELLIEKPVCLIDKLLEYRDSIKNNHSWSDLLRELAGAVGDNKNNYKWTEELISELDKRDELYSDIFDSILQGLEKEPIPPDFLRSLLLLIDNKYDGFKSDSRKQISSFILGQVRNNKEGINKIDYCTVITVIQNICIYHLLYEINADIGDNPNCLINAYGSVAGNLMESIFRLFAILQEEDKKLETKPVNDLFSIIEDVTFDSSNFAMNAKPSVALDYAFINYHRPRLAERMISLFDIDTDKDGARAMWHGFLVRGKYNDGVIKRLFKNFLKLPALISQEDDQIIRAFCFKTVGVAVYVNIDETQDKRWLIKIIECVSEKVRVIFAHSLNRELSNIGAEKSDQLWEDWIYDYWLKRNRNIPVPLSSNEIKEMMHWVVHFDKYFDAAVEQVINLNLPFSSQILLHLKDEKSYLLSKHPNSVALYFYHLLHNVSLNHSRYDAHCIFTFNEKLIKCNGIDIDTKNNIDQELVRLGIQPVAMD